MWPDTPMAPLVAPVDFLTTVMGYEESIAKYILKIDRDRVEAMMKRLEFRSQTLEIWSAYNIKVTLFLEDRIEKPHVLQVRRTIEVTPGHNHYDYTHYTERTITKLFLQAPNEVLALSREYLLRHLLPPTFSQEDPPPAGIIADYYEDCGMMDEVALLKRIANL